MTRSVILPTNFLWFKVTIGDRTYPLTMTTDLARFFDIRFTRTQSLELYGLADGFFRFGMI